MPKIQRVDITDAPKVINPSVPIDAGEMMVESVAAFRGAEKVGEASDRLFETAMKLQEDRDALTVVDHLTKLRNKTREYVNELRSRVGKNGIDLQPEARERLSTSVDEMTEELGSTRQRNLFRRLAASEVDQSLNQVAAHEYQQLTQYRNDLRQDSINSTVLSIRNSYGNQDLITRAIDQHVKQLGVIYAGQDVSDYKQADLSRLQLEAQTHVQHWKHTTITNELMTKFPGDYEGMVKHLMNPENYTDISIEEKNAIGNVVASEFSRLKAFKREQQEDLAGKMWADYNDIRYGSRRGERGALAKWHANVADLTRRGELPPSVMTGAISMQHQEQLAARQAEAWSKANDPFLKDDPEIAAKFTEQAIKDPVNLDITKMSEYLGKGLSYKTFEHLSGLKKSKEKAIWTTPNGRLVGSQLIDYRKRYVFDTKDERNNEEFNLAFKKMEKFLLKNPDASAEQINAEMKSVMKPYTRSWIGKQLDIIDDYINNRTVPPESVLDRGE